MPPIHLLFKRRIAAADGEQSPSISPQVLISKIDDTLRTITGQAEMSSTAQTVNNESRQDLQQFSSELAVSEDDDDDWRNDFLSPGSAISKHHERLVPLRSPNERSKEEGLQKSPTLSEGSSEITPEHIRKLSFTESTASSDRSSERTLPRYVQRLSSESMPFQTRHHFRHRSLENPSLHESHHRSNTFSSSTRPHNRSSSMTSGRQQRRPSSSHSLESLHEMLQERRQHFGPCNYKLGQTWNLIGNAHFRQEEYEKAIAAYEKALTCKEGCEKPSDSDHIAAAYGNIGTVCWSTGDIARSTACIRKALELRLESEAGRDLGESLTIATSYYQLGMALTMHCDFIKALDALNYALEIQQRVLGRKSVDVARTLDAIGKVHLLQGDADESMNCHQEAYAIKYEVTGEYGPLVISSLTNIAAAHISRHEDKEAILAYLAIRNAQLSEMSKANDTYANDTHAQKRLAMETGDTIQILVDLFTKTSAYQNAKLAADEALGLYQQAGITEDHPKMLRLKQSVKCLYSKAP